MRGLCWIGESCVRSVRGVCAIGEIFVRSVRVVDLEFGYFCVWMGDFFFFFFFFGYLY